MSNLHHLFPVYLRARAVSRSASLSLYQAPRAGSHSRPSKSCERRDGVAYTAVRRALRMARDLLLLSWAVCVFLFSVILMAGFFA
jgi:hypothetical protein